MFSYIKTNFLPGPTMQLISLNDGNGAIINYMGPIIK